MASGLKLRQAAVILGVLAAATAWNVSAPTFQSAVADNNLIAELLDRRNAATVLHRDAFSQQVTVPVSAIDTAIDRRSLLATLFSRVTAGQQTDQLRIEAWVRYLQDRIARPKSAPILDNGQAIYDPYWILKHQIAHCGQTNRIVVDGLNVAGFKARVVQLKAHVAAEVWLDGGWRFLDADWLNLGQFVRRADGSLPSAEEIHRNPELLDGLLPGLEFKLYPIDVMPPGSEPYDAMFSVKPYYYVKTATPQQENNVYFGWNYYETIRD